MEILIILIAVTLLVSILTIGIRNDNESFIEFILISSITLVSIILIATLFLQEKPKAIDVYRGKTTLKITYKDGVPDSTVVWKKNK